MRWSKRGNLYAASGRACMAEFLREDKDRLVRDLKKLRDFAVKLGASDAREIPASSVVVREWVRLKCRFGCGEYGRRLTCP
ncbi:MAG: DUF2284 domain-containing protein, partial [Thermofilaceae archaeon]|nr:DUF2284 domain-containing protein [Thermofilaceae archaeon]